MSSIDPAADPRPESDIATLVEEVAAAVPDRPAVIQGERILDFAHLVDRSRRLARYLTDRGLGCHRERESLAGHQVGQDLLAQYLHNSPAYLEGLIGSYRARVAPFNVNYRYTVDELSYLLRDAHPAAIQYHARFAPTVSEALESVGNVAVLLQVADGSGHELLPGAIDYERALASVQPKLDVRPSPDDLYLLYTGGTTGMPKGVLWRQADALVSLLGLRNRHTGAEWSSRREKLSAIAPYPQRVMPLAPYMHGAAQWGALQALIEGNTVVIPEQVEHFDPAHILDVVAQHQVSVITIVGDAFGRPLADALESHPRVLPSLRLLISGGAALNTVHKRRLAAALPTMKITENIGSSETGVQGRILGAGDDRSERPAFARERNALVLCEDRTEALEPGHDGVGWLATRGRVPLGYLGDQDKTRRTFPVVNGERLSVPGDRARLLDGDLLELLGRESTTVNTGGEKVFTEEVEAAVKAHPDVADAVVCGRPSERWGSEVVALVQRRPDTELDSPTLVEFCARLLARYKLPKAIIFVDIVPRSASGKADYAWARKRSLAQASAATERAPRDDDCGETTREEETS